MSSIKISIVMPTYNDENSIEEAFNSIIEQSYDNYELVIVNDGSTDGTEKVIKNYIKKNNLEGKFIYLYQENADQLNAINTALNFVTGDYIYILHSDDILSSNDVLQKLVDECEKNPEIDAFIPRFLPIINKNSDLVETRKIRKFRSSRNYNKELLLSGGTNLFIDMALFKKDVFCNSVYYNYLTWNRPFWAQIEKHSNLKLKSVEFPIFSYRIFEENYANSELGILNVYNGILRTFIDTTEIYTIPLFSLQRFIYKVCLRLKSPDLMCCIVLHKPMKNKISAIKKILPKEVWNYPYYKSILGFYKNYKSERTIELYDLPDQIYLGSDMRKFNKLMLKDELPEFYNSFMSEMEKGFAYIKTNNENVNKIKDLLHFFCITGVEILQ